MLDQNVKAYLELELKRKDLQALKQEMLKVMGMTSGTVVEAPG